MQEKFTRNEAREAYRELNFFRKGFKPTSSMCRRADGSITAETSEVRNRWRDFFKELLNGSFQGDDQDFEILLGDQDPRETDPQTLEEVRRAMKMLRNNKAPGKDNIPTELYKHGGRAVTLALHGIIEKIWKEEKMPKE